jgi:phosphoglycerate dehydrogenase-like enzyme
MLPNIVVPDPPFFNVLPLQKLAETANIKLKIYQDLAVDPQQLQARIHDAGIIIVDSLSTYNEASLAGCTHLTHLISATVALNHVDLEYCQSHGITVHNFQTYNSRATAEMAFANLISLLRQVPYANLTVRSNLWLTDYFAGEELSGKKLGIIGAGNIGTELISIAGGFDMRIHVHTKHPSTDRAAALGIDRFYSLEETLSLSDFIILAATSDAQSKHIMNERTLRLMKPSSYLINMGRQYLVDTHALARALYRHELAGAALDFVGDEPYALFSDDLEIQEMVNRPNVIVTPHIGFNTREANQRLTLAINKLVANLISTKHGKQ